MDRFETIRRQKQKGEQRQGKNIRLYLLASLISSTGEGKNIKGGAWLYYFLAAARFFFMGVPQQTRSTVAQPQSSSTVTNSPQSLQAYLVPTREVFFGAALALVTGFFVVAIFFLLRGKFKSNIYNVIK
jgi:hypothetical protein